MEYAKNNTESKEPLQIDGEEMSFCNCENNACETPYQAESVDEVLQEQAEHSGKERLIRGYRKIKNACHATANRIKSDWKQNDCGLRLKQTATYRLEVYKSDEDTPVDRFYTEKTNTCALRTVLIAAAAAVVLMCCLSGRKR